MCLVSMLGGKRFGVAGVEVKVIYGRLVTSTRIIRRTVWMRLNSNHLRGYVDASSANPINILPDFVLRTKIRKLIKSIQFSTEEILLRVVRRGSEARQRKMRLP